MSKDSKQEPLIGHVPSAAVGFRLLEVEVGGFWSFKERIDLGSGERRFGFRRA